MLVFTRMKNESVVIGDGENKIEVFIVAVDKNGKCRIGFDAPKHIPVHRREVYDAIKKQGSV